MSAARPMRPRLLAVTGTLAAIGLALIFGLSSGSPFRPVSGDLQTMLAVMVLVLAVVSDAKKVTIAYGNQRYGITMGEISSVLGVLTLNPILHLAVQASGVVVGHLAHDWLAADRVEFQRLGFNVSLVMMKVGVLSTPVLLVGTSANTFSLGMLVVGAVAAAELGAVSALCVVFHIMGRPFEVREWRRAHFVGLLSSLVIASSTFAGVQMTSISPGLLPFMMVLPLVALWAIPTIAHLLEDRNTWSRHGTFISTLEHASLEEAMRQLCTQLAVERIQMVAHINRYTDELQTASVTADGEYQELIVESDALWDAHHLQEFNQVHAFSRAGRPVPLYLDGARDALVVTVGASDGTSVWAATGYSARNTRLRKRATFPHSMHEVFASWTWNIHNALDARRRLAEVQQRASRDSVTGLANRDKFRSVLELELGLAADNARGPMTVAMVDLDSFKAMNDTWGHHVGDSYLVHIARVLQAASPDDATIARLSGDEFAILFPDVGAETAETMVARLLPAIGTLFRPTNNSTYHGSGSVGYACFPADLAAGLNPSDSTSQFMRHADAAMFSAKRVKALVPFRYDTARDERSEEHDRISVEITDALATDRLVVWYQPIFRARSLLGKRRSVAMLEALARIETPNGLLMPGDFVPIAEQTKQIHAITERVLDLACEQLGRWKQFDVAVAVNLSAANLLDTNLAASIKGRLDKWDIKPERLVVEVTETMMMTEELNAEATLTSVRELGVKVSIDDFGVGHSSLSRLLTLPIDELKVDREFLVEATRARPADDIRGDRAKSVLQTMIELAQRLGIGSTVEGVETMDALKLVADLGADHVQGYIASRPITVADATTLLEHTRAMAEAADADESEPPSAPAQSAQSAPSAQSAQPARRRSITAGTDAL